MKKKKKKHLAMDLIGMLLVFLLHISVAAASASPSHSVIIIGAGLSGISAAKTLHDSGIQDFLILEATNRIGGRIMKTKFGGLTIEKGANWLHGGGPVDNPVWDIATKINLRMFPSDSGNVTANTYKQEGGLYPKDLVDQVDQAATSVEEFCTKFSGTLSSETKKDADISILAAQILSGKVPTTPLEMVIDYYHNDAEDSEPPRQTSLKHTYPRHELVDYGERSSFVADPRGFEIVVQYLAKQFLSSLSSDPRLKLNKVVTEINYSKSGVIVRTEDGSTYNSKYVIVSASLGVLQSDLIKFNPPLPLWKRIAISDFSMSIYTKIFLQFPHTFWPTGPGTESFLYADVRRGYYPLWQHMENQYPGSNMMFVTVTGDESRRIELLTDKQIVEEIMVVLRQMFGNGIPEPLGILVPRWGVEKFYKGSFSNWPQNYDQERKGQLKDPVGPVYFTGEHCSDKYLGYASGAYLEGINSANDVVKCIKGESCRDIDNRGLYKIKERINQVSCTPHGNEEIC